MARILKKDTSEHRRGQLEAVEKRLGYVFSDKKLLDAALTHPSVSDAKVVNYERLEFLGDRVLGLMVAENLLRSFPDVDEGELSQRLHGLVSRETCAEVAQDMGLGPVMRLAAGETRSGGRKNLSILGDACEAVIAGIYLDGGQEAVNLVILPYWLPRIKAGISRAALNPKSHLQEWAARMKLPAPDYEVIEREGPDHAPIFTMQLTLKGYEVFIAKGRSRQEAEKAAAIGFIERHGLDTP
ncbi:MAG: ribonuclease III [Asticcacaulis sp.]